MLWTILELSIEFYMYFHKLSRQTPPHQVADGQCRDSEDEIRSSLGSSVVSLAMFVLNKPKTHCCSKLRIFINVLGELLLAIII